MPKKIALLSLVIILALVNWAIIGKEKLLVEGQRVYLELAPVDPRSLMQGDYMALRFRMADKVLNALRHTRPKTKEGYQWRHKSTGSGGYVVVDLDKRNIGTFKYLYNDKILSENEILMLYRIRNGAVKFATNAFFFQEGHGKYYQNARYGQFSVDDKGELLLVAMHDYKLNKLMPNEK